MTDPTSRTRSGASGATRSRAGGSETDRVAEMEARLARLEGSPGLRQRGKTLMDRVMPPEASEHFRNAGREHLLGVRSIVDHWIQRLDEADSRAAGRSGGRETIEIE